MRPLLHAGDVIRVRSGEARIGDVVVAKSSSSELTVHRLITRDSSGICMLRGDDTPAVDDPLPLSDLVGRVTAVEGLHGSRLDTPEARALGVATAVYAAAQMMTSHHWTRPRPRLVPSIALAVERALTPRLLDEDAFVLVASRPSHGPTETALARSLITSGLNWDLVLERSVLGQLGPLVFAGVKALQVDDMIPETALASLRRAYVANLARSKWIQDVFVEILARLSSLGIEVLAHKGVVLAAEVYGDPALRVAGDIDLSVRDDDRRRAEAAVADIRDALVSANPDRRDPDGLHVELDGTAHHDVDPSLSGTGRWQCKPLDWPAIWSRSSRVPVRGQQTLVPAPTDMLLTLVANAVRRGFTPVRLVCDIAHAIHRYEGVMDWASLATELHRTGLDHRSWIVLGLAADWFGTRVPASMLEPPDHLRTAFYERAMLHHKHRRPFSRLPTRLLWAGSWPLAFATSFRLALGTVMGSAHSLPRTPRLR
jgi:hypothetical protein